MYLKKTKKEKDTEKGKERTRALLFLQCPSVTICLG